MSDRSKIEWTDATWNPTTGCTKVSAGCKHCYAEREWKRLSANPHTRYFGREFTDVGMHSNDLATPLRWDKPRRIFVNSMSDLFHDVIPDDFIDQVFAVMALCPQHTFQILTKRPERMRDYILGLGETMMDDSDNRVTKAVSAVLLRSGKTWGECGSTSTRITTLSRGTGAREPGMLRKTASGDVERLVRWTDGEQWMKCGEEYSVKVRPFLPEGEFGWGLKMWPLPNVWLLVSVDDQASAAARIPVLRQTPAEVRGISAEPLLGEINLATISRGGTGPEGNIHWVIAGGESGPKARPMHPDWVRSLRNQCRTAGVQFLFKQHGEWYPASDYYSDDDNERDAAYDRPHSLLTRSGAGWSEDFDGQPPPGTWIMHRVGKKAAGRMLDGVLHDGYPEGGDK